MGASISQGVGTVNALFPLQAKSSFNLLHSLIPAALHIHWRPVFELGTF